LTTRTTRWRPSGAYNADGDLVTSGFDVGRVAIGQGGAEGQDLATPLQMAEVAATVANRGELMRPTFVQQVTDPHGRVTDKLESNVASTMTVGWPSLDASCPPTRQLPHARSGL
jgi:cell division protein FtsI/penicillin-binding protein 2